MRQKTDPKTGNSHAVFTATDLACVYRTIDLIVNTAMIKRSGDFPTLIDDMKEWAKLRTVQPNLLPEVGQ